MKPRIKTILLGQTEVTEAHGAKQLYGDERLILHNMKQPDLRGQMATQFAERWALVAAQSDGEDSAGRQKMRRLEPNELATHACACVAALFTEFESRGWLLDLPSFSTVIEELADPEDPLAVAGQSQKLPPVPGQSQKQASP